MPVRKAIIPLAGLGTRLLPATKAVPKGMLPLIDKPVVQYIVEEAVAAGLTDIALVTDGGRDWFGAHFGPAPELEHALAERGDLTELRALQGTTGLGRISVIHQDQPRGLGDAVLCCADYVGGEPFAILFGDNVLGARSNLLTRMIEARAEFGGTILALIEVPAREVTSRCVVSFEPAGDAAAVRICDLVEKPPVAGSRSAWIMIGRCICDPAIFPVLRETPPGQGGEVQLSDALRAMAGLGTGSGGGVRGIRFGGRRFDTGSKLDYVRAIVELSCARRDLAGEFVPWLRRYADGIG